MTNRFLNQKLYILTCLFGLGIILISCNKLAPKNTNSQDGLSTLNRVIPDIIDYNFHIKPILSDRCFTCHGPDKNKIEAGLSFVDFESATVALGDERDHYAIVPFKPTQSTLAERINSTDPAFMMPPPESNLTIDDYEKTLLTKWIEQGATFKKHWSFLAISNKKPSKEVDGELIHNEIDSYILERLENSPLEASSTAKKEYLIRRLSFTLTGLPPSIAEIDVFLSDDSPNAYEQLVDRFLSKESYGEHMASYWMDIARYADTHGYQDDLERVMWPWRDWVINAYNKNMHYDAFVSYQLAGDMMPNATKEQVIATGFNRNHSITQEGGVIPEEYRVEYVADRTLTFGKAFLGLTVECARCHDHKYDPISQEDYYSIFSFFNNVPEKGLIEAYGAIPEPYIEVTNEEIQSLLTFINNIDTLEKIPLMVMEEMENPRQTFILDRGMYDKPTVKVQSNVPESILPFDSYDRNRLGLTEWLFNKENPLTARVSVNRLWQMCLGKGLVITSDDFGSQGAMPSHPELLDFLAQKFMDESWDVKKMLKYIVMSRTYKQSSKVTEEMLEIDPDNMLYARSPRLRFSAENIRDNALATSGLLVSIIGGPSVKPYQPKGLWKEKTGGGGGSTSEYKIDQGDKKYRRSLYTFWKRTVPPPSMMTFDAISRDFCMVTRETTSTPLQALVMMNNPEMMEASKNLAFKTIESIDSKEDRVKNMFRQATSRMPKAIEIDELISYLETQEDYFSSDEKAVIEYLNIGNKVYPDTVVQSELAAYTMLASVIYNLDESLTRS